VRSLREAFRSAARRDGARFGGSRPENGSHLAAPIEKIYATRRPIADKIAA
jgi:hypothetical protein